MRKNEMENSWMIKVQNRKRKVSSAPFFEINFFFMKYIVYEYLKCYA